MADSDNLSDLPPYKPGERINEYLLREKLGGRLTFKAVREADQKVVVIKIFDKQLTKFQEWYQNEIRAFELTKDIPGVLQILDVGELQGDFYTVTEYMDGGTLQDVFLEHPGGMNLEDVLTIFTSIARTVDLLHQRNIIHRDLKPSNILLRKSRNNFDTFITDFGFVKFTDDSESYNTGTTAGTWWYIAPEAWKADPAIPQTKAVDIYAVGIMLYEALEGHVPFSKIEDVISNEPPLPNQTLKKTNHNVTKHLLRAISKNPDERPQSAVELLSDIQKAYQARLQLKNQWVGRCFKDYIIEDILPKGMISISFKARNQTTGQCVVLKMFDSRYSTGLVENERQRAFKTETAALQQLEDGHGVLKPADLFEQDHLLFIVTEYKEGGNLRELFQKIRNGTIDIDQTLDIFLRIAVSIDYVHENHIVHRDIKPDNVVFDENDGRINTYLTDFGVAEVLSTTKVSFETPNITGTYFYMAPELFEPKVHKTKAIDIYAFGIMFYEALEGNVPFDADVPAIINQILHDNVPEPMNINKNLGAEAGNLVKQALSKDPGARPSSAVDFINNIKKVQKRHVTQGGVVHKTMEAHLSPYKRMTVYLVTFVFIALMVLGYKMLSSSFPAALASANNTETETYTPTADPTSFATVTDTATMILTPTIFNAKTNRFSICLVTPLDQYKYEAEISPEETVIVLGKNKKRGFWEEGKFALIQWQDHKACWVEATHLVPSFEWSLVNAIEIPSIAAITETAKSVRTPEESNPTSTPTSQGSPTPTLTSRPDPTSTPTSQPNPTSTPTSQPNPTSTPTSPPNPTSTPTICTPANNKNKCP